MCQFDIVSIFPSFLCHECKDMHKEDYLQASHSAGWGGGDKTNILIYSIILWNSQVYKELTLDFNFLSYFTLTYWSFKHKKVQFKGWTSDMSTLTDSLAKLSKDGVPKDTIYL